jgi:uncharacterized membrane protein
MQSFLHQSEKMSATLGVDAATARKSAWLSRIAPVGLLKGETVRAEQGLGLSGHEISAASGHREPARPAVAFGQRCRALALGKLMATTKSSTNIGLYAYGLAAVTVGAVGLVWGDFSTNWQRVPQDVPYREALAYLTAAYELLAGLAILWRRTARVGAALLTLLFSIFALLWAIQVVAGPLVYDNWGNFFEEFTLVIAGAIAWALLEPPGSPAAGKTALLSRLFGVCAISFALGHFFYLRGAASFVPKWIPPGQMFWAVATGVFFVMAAAAILTGVLAGPASRLLAVMITSFEVLVWAPRLFSAPHDHFNWAGNGIAIALAAAAWLIAETINSLGESYASLPIATPWSAKLGDTTSAMAAKAGND